MKKYNLMKQLILSLTFVLWVFAVSAQEVYTIKADSVKLTGCDSAELIIENHTQGVPGFLYNTGHGRTVFKRGVTKINDSLFLIGGDTLKVQSSWSIFGNSGTNPGTNFIGTRDSVSLIIKVNNRLAGKITPDGLNTFIGIQSGMNNTGADNVGFGAYSLGRNTTGSYNTALGLGTSSLNTTGSFNTAVGLNSLNQNTTGGFNAAFGFGALSSNTGSFNTALGASSLDSAVTGHDNTAVGYASNNRNSTGSYNTALGEIALFNALKDSNVAIGYRAGYTTTNGTNNTFLGTFSGIGITIGGYNTILGSNITGLPPALNNNIILADGKGNRRINVDSLGNVMFNTTSPVAKNTFSGTGNFSDTLTATTMGTSDSSNRVASTAWVKRQGYGSLVYQHTIFTPTTGQTITLVNKQYNIINPSGSLASLTISLPASPTNNDVVIIKFTRPITSISYAGGTVAGGGIISESVPVEEVLTYDSATVTWY